MRLVLVLVLVTLPVLPAAIAGGDLDGLGSDFAEARRRARARLLSAGPEIEPVLIEAYGRAEYMTRAEILDVLAGRRCVAALPVVLGDLGTVSPSIREAQARFLVALGDPGRDALDEILAGEDRKRAAWAREVLVRMVRVTVERKILAETLGPDLHYEGQYAALERDRKIAAGVLMDMVANDRGGYRFVIPVEHVVDIQEIRGKAADALSDVGRPEDLVRVQGLLRQVRKELMDTEEYRLASSLESLAEILCYVLHGLGDVEPAESLARDRWDETVDRGSMWGREENLARFDLAMVLARMGRLRQSKSVYEEILRDGRIHAVPLHGNAGYNLACVLSLLGRIEDAFGTLLDAVRYDPLAVRLALEDGDLRPVREAYPDLEARLMAVAPPMPGDPLPGD